MTERRRVISDNATLTQHYQALKAGDVVVGRLRLRPAEEHILLDLAERGVKLMPSGLAQLASRSKVFQSRLFAPYMAPLTVVAYDIHAVVEAISLYQKNSIGRVVSKLDRRDAGLGIHLWNSIEELYTQASLGLLPFPFVVQPFFPNCRNIRVVMLDDYQEAYSRYNPHNFRNNLYSGGKSAATTLTDVQKQLCRRVMDRGLFPYGHLDLMVTAAGESYLAEINLRGGIRGARITPADYQAKVKEIHHRWLMKARNG